MKILISFLLFFNAASAQSIAQCKIAIDEIDDFDTTRVIAAQPVVLGNFTVTGNLTEDLEGVTYTQEAKAIFSYGESTDKVRSFFFTLGTVDRNYYLIDKGFNVMMKLKDGPIVSLFNVPMEPEFDRNIMMWKYLHTCVVPLEIFHMLKNSPIEKVRVNYNEYKSTIILEPIQQNALLQAVKCVEERLKKDPRNIKP
jgi:hypothetical protein